MINGDYYKDVDGYPRAKYQPRYDVLSWFLEQDIQGSLWNCDEMLCICKELFLGKRRHFQGTGNAHTVTIQENRVLIENEFADPPESCELTLEDFITVLNSWKQLIQTHNES